ncbi:DNA polymerase III subunit delta' [Siculibacillus lacustris]|uniref:DNA polymerase III subunit delta n=1 Tax=Siculibacillus lacustris TaxID=1549641 RepID=A0A4Q9VNJ7_9HYPH|nr:DNA polymerase III subunit delta' [Siculibacillus lacustris]TBW37004.1 DNA polymerase III subunit delta' [Siculibacillus lacustris]
MAQRPTSVAEASPEIDAIDGMPLPRRRTDLIEQTAAEATLLDAYRSGRIHHAWILGGPKGIGKATLAFRFARFVLAHADPADPAVLAARDLSVPADHPVARRIAGGAHMDLLHLRRPWDEKNKRFKTDLPVDEVRRTVGFFGSTAGEGGWRIAIVDAADDLNGNAANALLKVLEEPPPRSLFLVVAHAPGRLLPTIRSRCRRLDLEPLTPHAIAGALTEAGIEGDPRHFAAAADLADGSLRRAVTLLRSDGVTLWRNLETLIAGAPDIDIRAAHAFADRVAARGADDALDVAVDFMTDVAGARARAALETSGIDAAARWAEAHDAVGRIVARSEALNLDRKAAVLACLRTLAEAARN